MNEISMIPQDGFADGIPQMYAPFRNYLTKVVPLMLAHIWASKMKNGSSVEEEMMNSGWISRLITLDKRVLDPVKQNDIVGWPKLRDQLIGYIDSCKEEAELANMIKRCMQHVGPILEKRFRDGYVFPTQPFHCWWYTIHDNDTHLAVHLVNAYQPDSPFQHFHHFLTTMLKAIEHALGLYPDIEVVSCGSWLNQLPKFQQIWPESFKINQKILNETGGFGPGAWGQYMTVDGGFNHEKAEVLRKTGKHSFVLTEAQSGIGEVMLHLKKKILDTL